MAIAAASLAGPADAAARAGVGGRLCARLSLRRRPRGSVCRPGLGLVDRRRHSADACLGASSCGHMAASGSWSGTVGRGRLLPDPAGHRALPGGGAVGTTRLCGGGGLHPGASPNGRRDHHQPLGVSLLLPARRAAAAPHRRHEIRFVRPPVGGRDRRGLSRPARPHRQRAARHLAHSRPPRIHAD